MFSTIVRRPGLFKFKQTHGRFQFLAATRIRARTMHIEPIRMRWGHGDNYAYLVVDDATREATLIDPAEPDEVIPYIDELSAEGVIKLTSIINTHHHFDHAGGNEQVLDHYELNTCIAGKDSECVTKTPKHCEKFSIGKNIEVEALHTPCHTQDSICFYMHDVKTHERAVFTGDTLFIAGCGRFFEGTPAQMAQALTGILAKLPDDTKVYPGHEYTRSNVKFVKTILNNEHVDKLSEYAEQHEQTTGQFTIGDEKKYNPFMMIDSEVVKQALELQDRVEVMGRLRELKNKM